MLTDMEAPAIVLRRLAHDDVPLAQQVTLRALDDLNVRTHNELWLGQPPPTEAQLIVARPRYSHFIETDPDGALVATVGDEIAGVALALVREDFWGLSLLMVDPAHQGRGIGRALLTKALETGANCSSGLILASPDARAMRSYAKAGFRLEPVVGAYGEVDRSNIPGVNGVRDGTIDDLELCAGVDRHVRGAARDLDIPVMLGMGNRMYVADDPRGRGYVFAKDGGVRLLAATSDDAATRLLWTAIATSPAGGRVTVEFISARQPWAIDVVIQARLQFSPVVGGLFVRGNPGPLSPYLPSGAFL